MKQLYKIFHINTLTKKSGLIIIFIGIVILFIINIILPNIFYATLKSCTLEPISTLTKGTAARVSFILGGNSIFQQKLKNGDSISKLLTEYYNQPEKQTEMLQKIQDECLISSTIGSQKELPYKVSSVIISEKGDFFCKSEQSNFIKQFYISDWYTYYRSHLAKEGKRIYSPVFSSDQGVQYICYINTNVIGDVLYDFIIIEEFSDFKYIFSSLQSAGIEDYALLGANNEILYSNLENSNISFNSIPEYALEGKQFEQFILQSKNGADFIIRVSSKDEGLKLAVHASKDVLITPYKIIILFIKILLCISFALFIILVCIILNRSMKNLKKLSNQMLKVKNGDHEVRVNIKSDDEVETLGNTFNMMMDEIRDYIHQIIMHEKNEQKMQYILLLSEIDPHFIYNTLNTITYLAKLKKTDDIILVNKALISMLKDRLKIKGYESFDLVKNEMEVINQYMIIQKYLHGDCIKLIWNINDNMLNQRIPKNIIQPLVENALLHGLLANKDEDGEIIPGEIIISIMKKENWTYLIIKDTGVGMDDEKINKYFTDSHNIATTKGENIGIKNIRMRLQYLYGNKVDIKVNSVMGVGMSIEIAIPYDIN